MSPILNDEASQSIYRIAQAHYDGPQLTHNERMQYIARIMQDYGDIQLGKITPDIDPKPDDLTRDQQLGFMILQMQNKSITMEEYKKTLPEKPPEEARTPEQIDSLMGPGKACSIMKILDDYKAKYQRGQESYQYNIALTDAPFLFLLDKGANLEATGGSSSQTALIKTAATGNQRWMEILLERGADVTATDANKRNALIVSAECNRPACIATLLEYGADKVIDAQDYLGQTATMIVAGRSNSSESLKLLLQCNPDLTISDRGRKTAMDYAVQYGNNENIALLKDAAERSAQHPPHDPSLIAARQAAINIHPLLVARELLQRSTDVTSEHIRLVNDGVSQNNPPKSVTQLPRSR